MNNVEFEDIKVRLPELRTWFHDKEVYPSLQELRLLLVFLSDPYHCFTNHELIDRIDLTSKNALHVLVKRLRSMLDQKYIFAMRGNGYAFARVKE